MIINGKEIKDTDMHDKLYQHYDSSNVMHNVQQKRKPKGFRLRIITEKVAFLQEKRRLTISRLSILMKEED